jgi:hypothetical protein
MMDESHSSTFIHACIHMQYMKNIDNVFILMNGCYNYPYIFSLITIVNACIRVPMHYVKVHFVKIIPFDTYDLHSC